MRRRRARTRPGGHAARGLLALLVVGCAGAEADARPDGSGGAASQGGTGGVVLMSGGSGGFRNPECGADRYEAQRVPLDLYVMLDRSGSMNELVGEVDGKPVTKWEAVRTALADFAERGGADLNLALGVFPADNGAPRFCSAVTDCQGPKGQAWGPCDPPRACDDGTQRYRPCTSDDDCLGDAHCRPVGVCDDPSFQCFPHLDDCAAGAGLCSERPFECRNRYCEPLDYAAPALVMQGASAAAREISSFMQRVLPEGLTPTGPALAGALAWATEWARSHPERASAVLLATDGAPTEWSCDPSDMSALAELAQAAHQQTPSVPTLVFAVLRPDETAAAQAELDRLARAGGSSSALVVEADPAGNFGEELAAALDRARLRLLPCEVAVPTPAAGVAFDRDEVNLELGLTQQPVRTLPRVDGATQCGTLEAWYYDVPDPKPSQLIACPAACSLLRGDDRAALQVTLGCPTLVR